MNITNTTSMTLPRKETVHRTHRGRHIFCRLSTLTLLLCSGLFVRAGIAQEHSVAVRFDAATKVFRRK